MQPEENEKNLSSPRALRTAGDGDQEDAHRKDHHLTGGASGGLERSEPSTNM